MHDCGGSTSPGSVILWDVFGRLAPSNTMFNVKKMGFALRGSLFDLWVVTVNPGFILCHDPQEEVLIVYDIIGYFLVHMSLNLCLPEQLKPKFYGEPLHVQVLAYSVQACSVWKV